ncbi:hypothetical protein BESB_026490 [Besnoitia besnoiti]|uniref:Transmembrane protein n=1 Tax=Besnoitia besnoiti TaxID=94643 RepID=A0A2A9M117_BESBE|nr:uncharacterized protein BESB_026490 [Besnoitia besnoiti]PFH31675.1 hypothetical protein BESB_026490 [Besnoitia besnoiti]
MEERSDSDRGQVYSCDTEATADTSIANPSLPPVLSLPLPSSSVSKHSPARAETKSKIVSIVSSPLPNPTDNRLALSEDLPADVEAQAHPNATNETTIDPSHTTSVLSSSSRERELPPDAGKRLKSGYVPYNPYSLSQTTRQLLEFTELPFMILWVYLTYFIVIVALTASKVKKLVWVSAVVAGTLVGVGLNANAYRAIMYRGYPDVGMIVRFFLIPFGVSALSGLTNSLRERFMLVFPKDPVELVIAVACPTVVVCTLMLSRIIILRKHRVPITLRNFLLNGRIYY